LLEVSNIISRAPAYYASRSKRIVKSPKVFFLDPALSIFLSGYTDAESLRKSRELGGYFETLVYLSLRGLCEVLTPRAQIYYWRTSTRREVDFVLEHGRKILPVEAKITWNPTISDAKNLLAFMEEHLRASQGVIVYGGNELLRLHSRILAVPWWWLDR
jgi:predicted AAA+ superfamily ATPase